MASLLRALAQDNEIDTFKIFDDFTIPWVTGDLWTPVIVDLTAATQFASILGASGTAAAGGILKFTNDATDNDEGYLGTTVNPFLFANGKPCKAECKMQFDELNTDDNNVVFGFISGTAGVADTLIDNGGGPLATATMAVIYKLDGGTVWRCRSQIGAAVGKTDTVTNITANHATNYHTLRIEVNPVSSTNADVIFSVDEGAGKGLQQCKDSNGKVFKHNLVYTNAIMCGIVWGGKAGSANAEVMNLDYIYASQKR